MTTTTSMTTTTTATAQCSNPPSCITVPPRQTPPPYDLHNVHDYTDADVHWSFNLVDKKCVNEKILKGAFDLTKENGNLGITSGAMMNPGFSGNSFDAKRDPQRCLSTGATDTLPKNKAKGECILDPSKCEFGLTVTMWVRMDIDEVPKDTRRYFTATDKDGYGMYYQSTKLRVELMSEDKIWKSSCDLSLGAMEKRPWMNIGFRWNKWEDEGLEVLLHGQSCVDQIKSTSFRGQHAHQVSEKILVGCRLNPTTSKEEDFMIGGIDEVAFFSRRVPDSQFIVVLGGYNMLLAEENHLITTQTQLSTTTAFPPYDYANNMMKVQGAVAGDLNPFYKMADVYFPLRNLADPVKATGNVVMVYGRMGPGTAPELETADSFIKLGNYKSKCPSGVKQCGNGVAVAAWIFLPKTLPDKEAVIMLSSLFGTIVKGWAVVWNGTTIEVKVVDTKKVYSVPADRIKRGSWFNFAFSNLISANSRMDIYVGGKKMQHKEMAYNPVKLGDNGEDGDFLIGQKSLSVPKLRVTDVVVWLRYLHEFEQHRFLGITAYENRMLAESDAYWSADKFMIADQTSLPLYKTKASTVTRVEGPNGPNRAFRIKPDDQGWLLLGDDWGDSITDAIGKLPKRLKCFTSLVEGCKDGITVRLWIKLNRVDLPGTSFILSTGQHDHMSTGVSVFIREQMLFLAVGRGTRVKMVAITKDLLPINKWMRVVFSWSPDYPLWAAINGEVLVKDNRGRYQRRKTNWFQRPMIGRENSDAKELFGFADFDLQYVSYLGKYMPSDALSRDVNNFYEGAAYFWDRNTLISSTLRLLQKTMDLNGIAPGPSNKDVLDMKKFISLTGLNARIILGSFKDECISNPQLCEDGLTVSAWFRARKLADLLENTLISSTQTTPIKPTGEEKETGFKVVITSKANGQVIEAFLRTPTHVWRVTTKKVVPMNTWFNLGFTWSLTTGLKVILDAEKIAETTSGTAQTNTFATNTFAVRNNAGIEVLLDVYNLAVWNSVTPETKLHTLVGMKADHFLKTQNNDFFYPFDKPWTDLIQPPSQLMSNATYGTDRFGKRAGKTEKNGNVFPYVSLGNHSTGCVVDPSLCKTAVIVGMYLHMQEGNRGTLFSSGAQAEGNRGFLIEQVGVNGDTLNVTVADGTKVWWKTCSANTRKWFYAQVEWTPIKGITVFQDGWEITAISEKVITEARKKMDHHIVTLGRNNDNLYTGLVDAEFDDITFKYVKGASSKIPKVDPVKESCYENMDVIKYIDRNDGLNVTNGEWVADRFNTITALKLTKGSVTIDYKGKCLSDPTPCKEGISISFWTLMNNLAITEGYLFCSGAPTSRGIAVTAKLEAGTATLKFIVQTDTSKWEVSGTTAVNNATDWINIGLTWKSVDGLKIFFNGTLKASTATKTPSTVADTHTTVVLGKPSFADANYANAVFDDLAIWYNALPALNRWKSLGGLCGDVIETVDPSAFTPPPTTTTTPAPTTAWVQPTDITCNIWKCMVCASCESPALLLSFERISFDYPGTDVKCVNEVLRSCMNSTILPLKITQHLTMGINASTVMNIKKKDIAKVAQSYYPVADNMLNKKNAPEWKAKPGDYYDAMITTHELTKLLAIQKQCKQTYRKEINFLTASILSSNTCKETISIFPNISDGGLRKSWTEDELTGQELRIKYANKSDKYAANRQIVYSIFVSVSTSYSKVISKEVNLTSAVMINSNVMQVNLDPPFEQGDELCFKMKHRVSNEYKDKKKRLRKMDTICSYCEYDSNGSPKAWGTQGVRKIKSDAHSTECCSTHTTNFAILMQPIPVFVPSVHEKVLSVLTYIGLTISLISLLIFFFLIVLNPHLLNERNVIHLNLIVAMIIALFMFLISELVTKEKAICQAVAILIHFFFLATFCWLWVEALYLFYAVTSGITKGRLKCYIPFAWGVPLVIVSAVVGMNVDNYGSDWKCWLNADGNAIYSFVGPILLLISLNACVMMIVLCNLSTPAIKREDTLSDIRKAVKNTILLIPILGLTWVLGLLSVWDPTWGLLYVHVILNTLQGFFIFLFYCVGTKELRDKLLCRRGTSDISSFTSKNSDSLEKLVSRDKATEVFYLNPLPGTSANYVPVKPQPKSRPVTPRLDTPRNTHERPPLSPPPVSAGMPAVETAEKPLVEDLTSHDSVNVETFNL
ncbi:uncharacterized protein LOC135495345 isoform X2 [Lineus longissimus]|uniref:uncharacterized protein LOC135495345 isoform X2 n=1 Tax=Lineus longissimus TaxID=88925 RepID=UPI002B4FA3D4